MFDPNPIQYAKPWAIFWAVAVLAHGYVDELSSPIKVYHSNKVLIRSVCPEVSGEAVIEAFSRL